MNFGENLRRIRKQLNLSQRQLGAMLGKDGSHISKWETGVNEPNIDNIRQLAECLNVTVAELWSGSLYNAGNEPEKAAQVITPYTGERSSDPEMQRLLHIEAYLDEQLNMVRSEISSRNRNQSDSETEDDV